MILALGAYRNILRHPWLTVLAIVGVSLGVAVVSAVDLANGAAERAFTLAAETVAGKATHQIVGGPQGLPEELYSRLRLIGRFRNSAPVVSGTLQVEGKGGRTLQLVGVDPLAEPPIRSFSSQFAAPAVLADLMTRPNSVLLLRQTARELGVRPGDWIPVQAGGKRERLLLVGLEEAADDVTRIGLSSVVVADISSAQELLGMTGRLSRIDLVLSPGAPGARQLKEIGSYLPAGATIIPAGSRAGALDKMTRAFRLNLTALSLLSLVVGMFLIYNTMTFSVIRRRRLIGMLRALGVTRRQIFVMVCGEALLIGVTGTVIGLAGGNLLGEELTRLVTRTINDLYFVMEVREMPLLPAALAKAAFLGIVATVAAAIPAAMEATAAPPRAVLSRSHIEARRRKLVPLLAFCGAVVMAVGGAALLFEGGGIAGGFAGLFAVIVGYAMLVPAAVLVASAGLRPVAARVFGAVGKMAARGVSLSLSRTGVATAALVVAVAAGIGVGIMVGGFRLTVQSWLESWLQADVYVRSAQTGSGRSRPPLDPSLVESLSRLPGTRYVSLSRRASVQGASGSTDILAMEMPEATFLHYPFKSGDPRSAWTSFSRGTSVVATEPFANRHHLRVGSQVALRTERGERSFPVSAISYDYSSDTGVIIMSRGAYLANFGDGSVDGISFYASPGVDTATLRREIRERGGGERITIVSNRELKEATMAIFDRTFAITGILRVLIMTVAFVGILSALMAMQIERSRELAVLRAVGLTPSQLWGVVCGETAIIGLAAGILALPLGVIEAVILVFVINLRSFGWTMQFAVDPVYLLEAILLSIVGALLAGVYPSVMIARSSPALALKEEE